MSATFLVHAGVIGTEFRRQADRHVDDLCFDDDEVADDADDADDGGGGVCGVGRVRLL